MNSQASDMQLISKLMFRLLPMQILLAAIGAVNGLVSGYFATNYVGITAMTAVGIYTPVNILVTTSGAIFTAGASILCGKFMGQNEQEKMHNTFTVTLLLAVITGILLTAVYVVLAQFDLTGFLAKDPEIRALFNQYLLGQAVGLIPFLIGSQLTIFLSIEDRTKWALSGSVSYILVNILLNFVFVKSLGMEAFGLALAAGLGMWVFFLVQATFYFSGRSRFRFRVKGIDWSVGKDIFGIGFPTSVTNFYVAVRGFLVNHLILIYVGGVGISAFTAANNLLALFWAVPAGMLNVSRMIMGVSIGEEDRQNLTNMMRVVFRRFIPLMCAIVAVIILLSVPFTQIFYQDPTQPVYEMTLWGIRLLPFCMPLAIVSLHFVTWLQAMGRKLFVHVISVLDGVICVSVFTAILIPLIGMNGVYIANILNGVVIVCIIIAVPWIKNRRFPAVMDDLMLIPEDFGFSEDERIDLTVRSVEDVVSLSQQIQIFCLERGVDSHRAHLAALAIEEMAGNIVDHGFIKDNKPHVIDIRAACKNDDVIIRLRDNCIPFDPAARKNITDPDDPTKNIGIRMMYSILKSIEYQNILGLNVLVMRI